MTTTMTDDRTGAGQSSFRVVQADRSDPLSKCVEEALATYLHNMDGHRIVDLHRLVMEEVERPLLQTVVRHAEGNLSQAAKMLGLTRSTLRKRLADYGIERGR
jgi:Fis family transcriptional regulator, factor for inversion stimulation protein